ncbi:MAG: hypothetical protein ABSF03_20265 [Streptosporangiaceae bacterium]
MTRLETESATANQVGVIRYEFERLDFTGDDRAERLAACAALLGLGELASTKDLTKGQAGQLYRMLLDFRDRDELAAAADLGNEDRGDVPVPASDGVSLAEVILLAVAVWRAFRTPAEPGSSGKIWPGG